MKKHHWQKGEVATTLTLIGVGLMAVGAVVGSWIVQSGFGGTIGKAQSTECHDRPSDPDYNPNHLCNAQITVQVFWDRIQACNAIFENGDVNVPGVRISLKKPDGSFEEKVTTSLGYAYFPDMTVDSTASKINFLSPDDEAILTVEEIPTPFRYRGVDNYLGMCFNSPLTVRLKKSDFGSFHNKYHAFRLINTAAPTVTATPPEATLTPTPTVEPPSGHGGSCTYDTERSETIGEVTWNVSAGAEFYSLRVDNRDDGYDIVAGDCAQEGSRDFCADILPNGSIADDQNQGQQGVDDPSGIFKECIFTPGTPNSTLSCSFNAETGVEYGWWVHARDVREDGVYWIPLEPPTQTFSCPAAQACPYYSKVSVKYADGILAGNRGYSTLFKVSKDGTELFSGTTALVTGQNIVDYIDMSTADPRLADCEAGGCVGEVTLQKNGETVGDDGIIRTDCSNEGEGGVPTCGEPERASISDMNIVCNANYDLSWLVPTPTVTPTVPVATATPTTGVCTPFDYSSECPGSAPGASCQVNPGGQCNDGYIPVGIDNRGTSQCSSQCPGQNYKGQCCKPKPACVSPGQACTTTPDNCCSPVGGKDYQCNGSTNTCEEVPTGGGAGQCYDLGDCSTASGGNCDDPNYHCGDCDYDSNGTPERSCCIRNGLSCGDIPVENQGFGVAPGDIDENGECTLLGDWDIILNKYATVYRGKFINAITVAEFVTCYQAES